MFFSAHFCSILRTKLLALVPEILVHGVEIVCDSSTWAVGVSRAASGPCARVGGEEASPAQVHGKYTGAPHRLAAAGGADFRIPPRAACSLRPIWADGGYSGLIRTFNPMVVGSSPTRLIRTKPPNVRGFLLFWGAGVWGGGRPCRLGCSRNGTRGQAEPPWMSPARTRRTASCCFGVGPLYGLRTIS